MLLTANKFKFYAPMVSSLNPHLLDSTSKIAKKDPIANIYADKRLWRLKNLQNLCETLSMAVGTKYLNAAESLAFVSLKCGML